MAKINELERVREAVQLKGLSSPVKKLIAKLPENDPLAIAYTYNAGRAASAATRITDLVIIDQLLADPGVTPEAKVILVKSVNELVAKLPENDPLAIAYTYNVDRAASAATRITDLVIIDQLLADPGVTSEAKVILVKSEVRLASAADALKIFMDTNAPEATRLAVLNRGDVVNELAGSAVLDSDAPLNLRFAILEADLADDTTALKVFRDSNENTTLRMEIFGTGSVDLDKKAARKMLLDQAEATELRIALFPRFKSDQKAISEILGRPGEDQKLVAAVIPHATGQKVLADYSVNEAVSSVNSLSAVNQMSDLMLLANEVVPAYNITVRKAAIAQILQAKKRNNKAEAKVIPYFTQAELADYAADETASETNRLLAVSKITDDEKKFRLATTVQNLAVRSAAIMRLGGEKKLKIAVRMLLAQVDAAEFIGVLAKKDRNIAERLRQYVDSNGGSYVYASKQK